MAEVFGYMGLADIPFVYTIGGTNGKGTCSALLAAAGKRMGLNVGLYISPHLVSFEERVCINGLTASAREWCAALEEVEKARKEVRMAKESVPLTYFEYCTLACFHIFASHRLDLWILEVGLGGRLDAVNVIDTDCAVITSVELDHTDRLGHDRSAILYEKLGICRQNKPLVYGDTNPPRNFSELIDRKKPRLWQINRDYGSAGRLLEENELVEGEETFFADCNGRRETLPLSLAHPQLAVNMATAWQALLCYQGNVSSEYVARARSAASGWRDFSLVGRWQEERLGNCVLLFDVAHNPAAARLLAQRLQKEEQPIEIVLGLMKDKDWDGFTRPLLAVSRSWHLFPLPLQRAFAVNRLEQKLTNAGASVTKHSSALSLLTKIESQPRSRLFVFCGSFHLIGEVLDTLSELRQPVQSVAN